MAWTTPPTFVDTDVLSAAQLNVLSDDITYLYGLTTGVNVPFPRVVCDLRGAVSSFQIRHRAQFLNVYLDWSIDAAQVDHLQLSLTIGGYELTSGGGSPIDPWVPGITSPGYFAWDVSSLTVGTWYTITVAPLAHNAAHALPDVTGDTYFHVLRLFESDTDYS